MYDDILSSVKTLASAYIAPFTSIGFGSIPTENGLAMYIGPGAPIESYLDRGSMNELSIVLNGKHSNQQSVLTALSNVHKGLTRLLSYPRTDDWQILNIETGSAPNYIDQESSGQWVYGSILKITFYAKGVN